MNLIVAETGFKEFLFTENETNAHRLWGTPNGSSFVKDAFHEYVIAGRKDAVTLESKGTKAAAHCAFDMPPGKSITLKMRLFSDDERTQDPLGGKFDATFSARIAEANDFYAARLPKS